MVKMHIQGVPISISEEEAALHRLADWICWCLAAGIPQTTLYIPDLYDDEHDHHHQQHVSNNVWETCVDRLQKAVIKAERRVFGSHGRRHVIRWMVLETFALERFTQGGAATPVSSSANKASGFGDQDNGSELEDQHHLLGLSSRSHSYNRHHHEQSQHPGKLHCNYCYWWIEWHVISYSNGKRVMTRIHHTIIISISVYVYVLYVY
jgi:hypothetical protein